MGKMRQTLEQRSSKLTGMIVLVWISVYFFTENIRSIGVNEQFGYYNVLFMVIGGILLILFMKKQNVNFAIAYVVLAFSVIWCSYSFLFLHYSFMRLLQTAISLCLPLFFVGVKLKQDVIMPAFRIFLILFNWLIVLLLIVGAADFLSGGSIQLYMAGTLYNGLEMGQLIRLEHSFGVYRFYSFMGHPLTNAQYFLTFFILNHVYARRNHFLINKYLITCVTLLGLLLSSSKTALVLGVFLVLFCSSVKKNRILYYMGIFIILIVILNTPLFQNNLMQRYISGLESGDITSGRNGLLEVWVNSRVESLGMIFGGGVGHSREVAESLNGNIFNFEYPLIMLAYDYGIMGTAVIYLVILLYPAYLLIKDRSYYEFVLFLVITAMANSNNGLANLGSDAVAQLCLLFFIIRNTALREREQPVPAKAANENYLLA
ncbi:MULTISPECIES: hypothetical protein [Paenibacillus]|uniref:O-antigen ligase domain-containing protein n=1 Tax=Paenibacillus albilobatus TaxID=2716884 RepID=A0A919XED0_9BACL|nr:MULTISPECIES: hypothetical protein [Paenibacillus]GIO30134.1 hypothetical protein J2TS6_12750 [Paenibacillus albilobatus]